ncbi:hypothetical protein VPH35_022582 [Triticum aestivum]
MFLLRPSGLQCTEHPTGAFVNVAMATTKTLKSCTRSPSLETAWMYISLVPLWIIKTVSGFAKYRYAPRPRIREVPLPSSWIRQVPRQRVPLPSTFEGHGFAEYPFVLERPSSPSTTSA